MKKLFMAIAAVLYLSACSLKENPANITAAEFEKVTFTPTTVTSQDAVQLSVRITSTYGLQQVQTVYSLDGLIGDAESTQPIYYSKSDKDITFTATIPKQKEKKDVTFRVVAVTAYGVISMSEICQYVVAADVPAAPEEK